MNPAASQDQQAPTQAPLRQEPLPRPLAWACLIGLLLFLVLAMAAGDAARRSRLDFHRLIRDNTLSDQEGASLFRLRVDPANPRRYVWHPLFIGALQFPDGPLPGQEDYKVKAVAVFRLEKAQRLYFRIRGNDGVSILLQGQRVFDDWRPVHLGILSDFTEVAEPGLNLLEVDHYLGRHKGTLEVRAIDSLGQELELKPLRLSLDAQRWQELQESEALFRRLAGLMIVLAAVCLAIPLAWVALRNPLWLRGRWDTVSPLLPGFWTGFCLVMLYKMGTYVGIAEDQDIKNLVVAPLMGGGLGALAQGLLLAPAKGKTRGLAATLAPWRAGYLRHEAWLTPLLAFAGLLCYMSWVVEARGGDFPQTWLNAPWDARHYKDIMIRGLVMERLEWGGVYGNYAWHPFFPWLARGLLALGLEPSWALVGTAWLVSATAFLLVFRLARDLFGVSAARWTLLAMAAYPCSFYLLIGYPYGTAIALTAGYFLAIRSGRHWLALALGSGLGMTYPTAVLAGVLPIFLLAPRIKQETNPWPAVKDMVICGAGPAIGLLGLCAVHWWRFGDFLQPIAGHGKWGRAATWPWDAIMDGILHEPPMYPEAIITVVVLLAMVIFAHRFQASLWCLLILIFIIGPATGALESTYRQYLMAWPLFVLIGSSPRSRWLKAAVLWLFLYFAMTWYLPLWLVGDLV